MNILERGKRQVHLSRSKLFTNPQNEECVLVCAGDESINGAVLWDANSGHSENIQTGLPVLDIEMIEIPHYANTPLISCLSENIVKLYNVSSWTIH